MLENKQLIVATYPREPKAPKREMEKFEQFIQNMTNRRYVGGLRYGRVDPKQRYLTRLLKEVESYRQTGNAEQLINIAVYAFLEYTAPEHKHYHFDNTVDSVTRNCA